MPLFRSPWRSRIRVLYDRKQTGGYLPLSLWNDEQEKPIQHLRVIDLTVMLTGPYLTRLLAQYGADVVKVEKAPAGDPLRALEGTSLFELLNQGKKSLGVDLTREEGVALVKQLAAEADIFVENFREGVMEKLGLGYSDLTEDNPDLLYVSLRGLSGKNAVHAGHDLNFIATSGVGEWFLESGVPNYSTFFGDIIGGVFVPALKVLMHMANPNRRGMHLVSYMDEGFRSLYLSRAYDELKSEHLPEEKRSSFGAFRTFGGNQPHSRFFRCRDGHWVSLQAIQKKHWDLFCEVIDHKDWKERMHDTALLPELEKLFLDAPSTYWEALSSNRELCLFRVIPWHEHISFSQARPQLTQDPFSWAGFAECSNLKPAPQLGADTYSVLHSMGISNKDISDHLNAGVLCQTKR